jgi:hypothetical protein
MRNLRKATKNLLPRSLHPVMRQGRFLAWYAVRKAADSLRGKSRRFSVAVLYLTAEKSRYPATQGFVDRYRTWLGADHVNLIRIDNFHPDLPLTHVSPGVWETGGDNSSWEFSGWKRGLRSIQQLGLSPQVVVFVNDACLNHRRDELYYRMRFDWRSLTCARSGLVGCLDRSYSQHIMFGHDVSTYVRSNFFAMPFHLAGQLPWDFMQPPASTEILPVRLADPCIAQTKFLNESFRQFSEEWITKTWHRAAKPTNTNWPFLRQKWIACFNERMLTASVRALNAPVFDAQRVLWG